jgi:hypothetical protein
MIERNTRLLGFGRRQAHLSAMGVVSLSVPADLSTLH